MSELKIKYKDDNEFKCVRRIACKLGLSMPDSDDYILNLSQFRRIDRAINAEFESMQRLTAIATKHATLNDERYELLEKQKSDIEKMLDQLFKHEKVDAWLVCKMNDMLDDVNHQLEKSRIESEKGDE